MPERVNPYEGLVLWALAQWNALGRMSAEPEQANFARRLMAQAQGLQDDIESRPNLRLVKGEK